jgi:molybdate transport system ATP-binding protein
MNLRLHNISCTMGAFSLQADLRLDRARTGLFGASGAGKTTMLELIAGLKRPVSGFLELDGNTLAGAGVFVPPEKRSIGYVPQDLALFPHLSVEKNLRYALARDSERRLAEIVSALRLGALLPRRPHEISGGERQRAALGRALARSPRLLLLDEPLSSLDGPLKREMLDLLKSASMQFETPILYVTHDPAELAELCEEVIVLEHGKVAAQAPFQELFQATDMPSYTRRPSAA